LEAQNEVSDFEREIFDPGHQLTDEELVRLRALRHIAASRLSALVSELDTELERLHPTQQQQRDNDLGLSAAA
jgi:hypothetical protein